MFKIGDFSQLGQVSVRTLHHYDERGLLKPARIDDWTGYRFYSVEQLPRLNRILALKDLGFSLDQISQVLADEVPAEKLRGMLMLKQAEIERQLTEGRTRLMRVEARLKQIEREGRPSPYEVVLKKTAPRTVASTRATVPTLDDMPACRCDLYDELYDGLERLRIQPKDPEYALYHAVEYLDRDIDMEAAVAVDTSPETPPGADGLTFRELPAVPEMASVVHRGSAWEIPQAVTALFSWVGANGYAPAGPYRELHLYGRENELFRADPSNVGSVLVEIQLPVQGI
ncbi:MerR family transcriptional regulator [Rubrobacter marinus]|uniref:MerR family transcriptional regulator n=1 Tax=Rubrobacter marinus TaxID=2653852 RepID=UPI0014074524|nr:MerR family transcriptional regulator [Rubrobacter marinus]